MRVHDVPAVTLAKSWPSIEIVNVAGLVERSDWP